MEVQLVTGMATPNFEDVVENNIMANVLVNPSINNDKADDLDVAQAVIPINVVEKVHVAYFYEAENVDDFNAKAVDDLDLNKVQANFKAEDDTI